MEPKTKLFLLLTLLACALAAFSLAWGTTKLHQKAESPDRTLTQSATAPLGNQRGWFTHKSQWNAVETVVPETELHRLGETRGDPVAPFVGASGWDLVSVAVAAILYVLTFLAAVAAVSLAATKDLPGIGDGVQAEEDGRDPK